MGSVKTPWSHGSWPKGAAVGVVIAIVAFAILMALLSIAVAVFMVFVIVWNVQDINAVGPNFWNIAWIVLAAIVLLSIVGSALRGNN